MTSGRLPDSRFRELVAAYYNTPPSDRIPVIHYCKQHGISKMTFFRVKKEVLTDQELNIDRGTIPAEPAPLVPQRLATVVLPEGEKPKPRASSAHGLLTIDEAIKLLSDRARSSGDVRAIESVIEHLKSLGNTAGPRAPMGKDERIARLTTIMEGCTRAEIKEAFSRAYPPITV